jgi:hypothetical protein
MPGFPTKTVGTPTNRGKARLYTRLLRAGEVGAAVADFVVVLGDGDDDGAVSVGGAAGVGVVGEAVLSAEFAVDAVEDSREVLDVIGIKHGAAGGVGHGFEGVFAGGVAAAFVF